MSTDNWIKEVCVCVCVCIYIYINTLHFSCESNFSCDPLFVMLQDPLSMGFSYTMEYYLGIKKNEICSNMDGCSDYHAR